MGIRLSKTSHQIIFLILLPTISAGLTYLLNAIIQGIIPQPWVLLVDSLGVLGIYSILFHIFNITFWQLLPPGFLGIVNVPNLNGTWEGKLKSSYDNKNTSYKVTIQIIQTFLDIKVFAYFERSWSYSIVADFYKEADARQVLNYVYRNDPRANASSTMHSHYGAAKHEYLPDTDSMECYYYNEPPPDRGWYGNFNVKRRKRKLKELILPTFSSTRFKR